MKTLGLNSTRWAFVWMVAMLVVAAGCKDETGQGDEPETGDEYLEINNWILSNMEAYYLWNEEISTETDKTLQPGKYFDQLLYKEEDRFSWIQDDFIELMNYISGVTTEAGYDFNLYSFDKTNVVGCITYIKPGTPAEAAGLKRGDFFMSINGTNLTTKNYSDQIALISEPHTLGKVTISDGKLTDSTTPVSLSVIEYPENPLLLDTVYTIESKKIGYFVYNFFARDSESLGIKYEKELNDLFGDFKTKGIDELIIDLRYNGGGTIITAQALASMISNRSATDIFGYEKYNTELGRYLAATEGKDYNIFRFLNNIERYDSQYEPVETVAINKLTNLSKLYLIVTGRTASASELIINGLKPYMDVVLVGETTYGKNVGSITIYETDPEKQKINTWGMQPIVLKAENVEHFSDYGNGFKPDIPANEFEVGMLPLGDTNELMLSETLNHIFGKTSLLRKTAEKKHQMIGSSVDRTPERKNMYIDHRFFRHNQ